MTPHKRTIYLQILEMEDVHTIINTLPRISLGTRILPTHKSVGCVLSSNVFAKISSPSCNTAAMDGIAVKAEKTYSAREDSPLFLTEGTDFIYVNTGNPIPTEYNAVIMIEYIVQIDDTTVQIEAPASVWQHVRKIGEDIVATQMVLPKNHSISAYDIGYLLTAGIFEVEVYEELRICILPTGDELCSVEDQELPAEGHVIESNSHMLKALLTPLTQAVTIMPRLPDTKEAIENALKEAVAQKYALILLCAGSSAGSKDFARTAIESIGTILFHGIKAMPGKPTMLGIADNIPIVGVPGYPGSTSICFEKIIKPIVEHLSNKKMEALEYIEGFLVQDIPSKLGIEEYCKVRLGAINGRYIAIPLPKATGSTSTLALAEGICTIPAYKEGISKEEKICIDIYIPKYRIDSNIVCIGSHDDSLDILDSIIYEISPYRLRTVHTGSMGGIYALANKTTHCAGMHLLDVQSGEFTIPYLKKYLPQESFVLYTLALRSQCLYLPKNNPKNIHSIADIATSGATFINRQKGSGTRILFDYLLEQEGISPQNIQGYRVEEYSHLATALAVSKGFADCALGIYSAGVSLGLTCIPITEERYEIVLPKEYASTPMFDLVHKALCSSQYKKALTAMGGYNTSLTGEIREYQSI